MPDPADELWTPPRRSFRRHVPRRHGHKNGHAIDTTGCRAGRCRRLLSLVENGDEERTREKEIRKKCDKMIRKYMRKIKLAMKASGTNESNGTDGDKKNKKNRKSKKRKRQSQMAAVDNYVLRGREQRVIPNNICNRKPRNSSNEILNKSEKLARFIEFTMKNPTLQKSEESEHEHTTADRNCLSYAERSRAIKQCVTSRDENNMENISMRIRNNSESLINFIESVIRPSSSMSI